MVAAAATEKKRGAFADFLIRLVREKPLGTFGAAITLAFLLMAIFSDFLAPYDMNEIGVVERLPPPGVDSLLGSDHLGRDVFSHVIHGVRISVIVGLAGSTNGIFIATLIGVFSGYIGGRFDTVLQRFVDAWVLPPEVIEQYGDISDWKNLVGTGPYELIDWVIGTSFTYTKNPDYWGYDEKYPENRLPYIDELRGLVMTEKATILAGLRSRKLDYTGWQGVTQINNLVQALSLMRTNPELVLEPFSERSETCASPNLSRPPFDDIRVRSS